MRLQDANAPASGQPSLLHRLAWQQDSCTRPWIVGCCDSGSMIRPHRTVLCRCGRGGSERRRTTRPERGQQATPRVMSEYWAPLKRGTELSLSRFLPLSLTSKKTSHLCCVVCKNVSCAYLIAPSAQPQTIQLHTSLLQLTHTTSNTD